jgi:hypothetical protein
VLGAPSALSLGFFNFVFIHNSGDIDLSDVYVFAPDGQTTRTSFLLVINPAHVCGIFRPSADAENAKR